VDGGHHGEQHADADGHRGRDDGQPGDGLPAAGHGEP
jgi:hypothetical protein